MSVTVCFIGGPADGALMCIPERSLGVALRVPINERPNAANIEDLTLDFPPFREGTYIRTRAGRDVTFYEWKGVS